MQLDITGRHIEITPALRSFTEEKLAKLERLLDGPLEVHVVLGIEKHRHTAEIQVKSRTTVLSGAQETGDLYASIGEVIDKLERQAVRHKDKVRNHKRPSPRDPVVAAAISESASPAPVDESEPAPAMPQIVRSKSYRVKPLSAEDAMLELEASGDDLLMFRDATNDRVSVLYRQRDGSFRLVEPEF